MKDEFDKQLLAITGGRNALPVEVSKAHEAVVAKYLDLIPIEGTRYAIPKERWEAAVCVSAGLELPRMTKDEARQYRATDEARQYRATIHPDGNFAAWWGYEETHLLRILTAALNGEVLPVEAVGQFTLLPGDEPVACLMPRIPGKAGTAPVIDEGRTVALVAEKEQADD